MAKQLIEFAPGFSAYVGGVEEATFFYKEIFTDHTYDIADLPGNAFMIDAGANVGMFTLYMKKKYPSSTILAFEPAPATFSNLADNVKLHKVQGVELYECALGCEESTQTFTFYPNFPGNSTLVPSEKELVKKTAHALSSEIGEGVERMYKEPQEIPVSIRRLSSFLQGRKDLTSIDLLKVDVEGAELETLQGIDEEHWSLVRNVVVEVCDLKGGQLDKLEVYLKGKGFIVTTEIPDWTPKEGKMFMVIGKREAAVTQ